MVFLPVKTTIVSSLLATFSQDREREIFKEVPKTEKSIHEDFLYSKPCRAKWQHTPLERARALHKPKACDGGIRFRRASKCGLFDHRGQWEFGKYREYPSRKH
ncbi:hypothetical protein Tco_0991965 [Tanacetum coccineum]|uniref:Uncharacterized protein n=1 Tax=Tanacetum coccineum TaxID=301880 RepID=A0ABQ5F0Q8_9ASTR